MKGTVTKFDKYWKEGTITDEDNIDYPFYMNDVVNARSITKGNIMEFDVLDDGQKKRLVNIKKIGHGTAHPFIRDLEDIETFVNNCEVKEREGVPKEQKDQVLRNLQMMMNYFSEVCDYEWKRDLREAFKPPKEDFSPADMENLGV